MLFLASSTFPLFKREIWDVPVVQRVRFHLPMKRVWVETLVGEVWPHALWPKKKKHHQNIHNRSNIVTNSIKTSAIVHIKKKKVKKNK